MSNVLAIKIAQEGDEIRVRLSNPLGVPPACAAFAFAAKGLDYAEQMLRARQVPAGKGLVDEAIIHFPPAGVELMANDDEDAEGFLDDGPAEDDVSLRDYLDAANRVSMTLDVGDAYRHVGGLAEPVCVLATELYTLLQQAIERGSYGHETA